MKLSRLIGILLIIESKQNIKARDLSELFEVSIRTIYRDVELLCEAGIPIYATSGPGGGFSLMEGYRLSSKSLDTGEMERLILSVYAQSIKEKEISTQDTLLLKFKKMIPQSEQQGFERLLSRTKIDPAAWWGTKKPAASSGDNLDTIRKSIYKLRKIRFDYNSNTGFTSARLLRPYGLVQKGNAWYAVGFAEERGELRTFHCDRMSNIQITEASYEIPVDFDLNLYWERSTRAFIREASPNAAETSKTTVKYSVELFTAMELAERLGSFNILSTQQEEKGIRYKVDLISERTALNLLLPHLGKVKIIAPLELREKILEIANNILQRQND